MLSVLAIYLSLAGLITFSLFILEESIQTAMFGTWPAQDAKDWELVQFGSERMREANTCLKTINYCFGWIQPLAFVSYRSFGKSVDLYIASLEARIFANAPELFHARTFSFAFTPQSVAPCPEGWLYTSGRVTVISAKRHPQGISCRISGEISLDESSARIIVSEK